MSYLKDREIWLSSVPTGNPPAGYVWVFIQNGVFVVRDSNGVDKIMATTTGTVTNATSASYVEYSNVANKPALISGSSQVSYTGLSNIPAGIVSSSAQVGGYGVFATTGSNVFQANQTITGSLFITQNLVVAGSSSIQYISSSVLDIADNIITVNAFNPAIRFGGLAVIDSGSSPQVSGSLLFDSIKDQWIFVHQNQSVVTSSVVLMGPETYNDLGNESYISANRLPKGSGVEHLRDSNITDTGTIVSVNSNTQVTGSMSVAPSITVTGDGSNDMFKAIRSGTTRVVIKNGVNTLGINTDTVNNPLTVNGGADFNGNVGIGYTSPSYQLSVSGSSNSGIFVKQGSQIADSPAITNFYSGLTFENTTTTNAWSIGYSQGAKFSINYFNASSTYTRVLTADTNGNVGIGTSSPTDYSGFTTLHVNGKSGSSGGVLRLTAFDNSSSFNIYAAGTAANFNTTSAIPFLWYTQDTERMRLTSSGNVGIGTSDPGARLHISDATSVTRLVVDNTANAAAGAGVYFRTYSSGTLVSNATVRTDNAGNFAIFTGTTSDSERLRITSGGNVGIGTTSPGTNFNERLQVTKADIARIGIQHTNTTGARQSDILFSVNSTILGQIGFIQGYSPEYDDQYWIRSVANLPITFRTNDTERMRISSTGAVTKSSQPAWSVGLSGTQTISSPQIIAWDQSSGNDCFIQGGVTLNGTNGRVTVPVAGKYMLFASIRTEDPGAVTGTNLNIRRNGTTILRHYVGGAVNSAGSYMYIETRPVIINCAANDYIDFLFDSVPSTFSISAATNTVVRFGGFLMG